MFDRMLMTILNKKMKETGQINQEEFEKIQKKINMIPNSVFDSHTKDCYNQNAV